MYFFLSRALPLLVLAVALNAQKPTPQSPIAPAADTPALQVPPATTQPGVSAPDVIPPETATPGSTPQTPDSTTSTTTVTPNAPPEVIPSEPTFVPEPESAGPGILSRPFTVTPLENHDLRFRPFLTISGLTDSGLTQLSTSTGQITSTQSYGLQGGFGISGRQTRKKDTLELEFRGDVYHYTPNSSFDGGNYVLNLTYQHYFTKHISLALTENASLYSNNYSLLNSASDLSIGGAQTAVTPNTQLFDNRTISLSTGADVVIQKSARLSFDLGATGFLVRRESSSLYGTVGSQARADTSYRATRHLTIGGYYAFSHYSFDKAFGGSDVQTGGAIISYSIARGLELRLRGGGSNVQTSGVQTIMLDPVIAAILGVSQGSIIVRRTNIVPDISAQLFKNMKLGTASLQFIESVTPGNGLYLTSRHVSMSGYYDYTGIRRWTFSAGAGRDTLSTLGILLGQYTSTTARIGVDRTLSAGFQATAYSEYRHYDVSEVRFLRNAYRINLGLAWSPSERPLKLW